jgi:hypothetical protein
MNISGITPTRVVSTEVAAGTVHGEQSKAIQNVEIRAGSPLAELRAWSDTQRGDTKAALPRPVVRAEFPLDKQHGINKAPSTTAEKSNVILRGRPIQRRG